MARSYQGQWIWAVAVGAPLLVCLAMVPFRGAVPSSTPALILVLIIVAVASLGRRWPALATAASAGLGFDFFLTQPYQRLSISSSQDLQTSVLLLAVGVAVTELALWGRRQQAAASKRAGYLEGLEMIALAASTGACSPASLVDAACDRVRSVLSLERCRFTYGPGFGNPRIEADGRLRLGDHARDVDTVELPAEAETELLVESGGRFMGRFLMTPRPGSVTTRSERLVAVALAAQVGATLRAYTDSHPVGDRG